MIVVDTGPIVALLNDRDDHAAAATSSPIPLGSVDASVIALTEHLGLDTVATLEHRHFSIPRPEFARLEHPGALHRLADGYYAVVPDDQVGQHWLPALDAVALGVATAGGHLDGAALMGISAARAHDALPRALNVAVVAANRHRGTLELTDRPAQVHFVRRDVARLDLQRHRTELGSGWITTPEQTALDLAARPDLGGVPDASREAIGALLPRCDTGLLRELARTQRSRRAVRRARRAGP